MTESEKTEKLNDLMNKISFALKDATLAQGFEIICKENKYLLDKLNLQNQRLIELKKENEEMKNQIEIQYKENQTLGNNNAKLLMEGLIDEKLKCFSKDFDLLEIFFQSYEKIEKENTEAKLKRYKIERLKELYRAFNIWITETEKEDCDEDYKYVYQLFKNVFWSAFYTGACKKEDMLKPVIEGYKEDACMMFDEQFYQLEVLKNIENALKNDSKTINNKSILEYVSDEIKKLLKDLD